jgi:hypothetical protein
VLLRLVEAEQVAGENKGPFEIRREFASPIDAAAIDEAHFGGEFRPLSFSFFANGHGKNVLPFAIAFLPGKERRFQAFAQRLVGKQAENPFVDGVHGIGAGGDAGNTFAHRGPMFVGDLFDGFVVAVVDDEDLIAGPQSFEKATETRRVIAGVDDSADFWHEEER